MVKKAVKKPVKKAAKTAAKKVVRSPRKRKAKSIEEKQGWRWDPEDQKWIKDLTDLTTEDLRRMLFKLSTRVTAIEVKIDQAEQAGAKIQADLERWRTQNAPKWKARQPSDGKPAIAHAKVLIMLRNGTKTTTPQSVDAFTWSENGDRTIIAYAVV